MTVLHALRRLGETPDAIAAALRQRHIRGHKLSTQHDPLAMYLRDVFEAPTVHVERAYVEVSGCGRLHDVPKAVQEFILAFDQGAYPELEV